MEINISVDNDTLSEDELKKLVQCIREIEQNKPERHINIFIDAPEKTMKEMKYII
jgi:lipoate synthase